MSWMNVFLNCHKTDIHLREEVKYHPPFVCVNLRL
jgi:hypothetical protein